MPAKIYKVDLSADERRTLEVLTRKGKVSARKMKRAQILMKADEGWEDEGIVTEFRFNDLSVVLYVCNFMFRK